MTLRHPAKIAKYWVHKWYYYIKALGPIRGTVWFYKLRIATRRLPATFRIGTILLRNTTADIGVFEKFYIYPLFDEIVAGLPENTSLLDLGGNIGLSTRRFLELCPNGNACVVEPAKINHELLKVNLSNFPKATIIVGAVGSYSGTGVIKNPTDRHDSFTVAVAADNQEGDDVFAIYDLNTLISQTACTFLKCDIEGGEFDIFRPANPPHLEKVKVAVVEVHSIPGEKESDIFDMFERLGFRYSVKGEDCVFTRS